MGHDHTANAQAAELASGHHLSGIPGCEGRGEVLDHADGTLAPRAQGVHVGPELREAPEVRNPAQSRINPLHVERGFLVCGECAGDPHQYLIDVEEACPCCGGRGFIEDPDYIDGDARGFDPHSELGTEPGYRRTI